MSTQHVVEDFTAVNESEDVRPIAANPDRRRPEGVVFFLGYHIRSPSFLCEGRFYGFFFSLGIWEKKKTAWEKANIFKISKRTFYIEIFLVFKR